MYTFLWFWPETPEARRQGRAQALPDISLRSTAPQLFSQSNLTGEPPALTLTAFTAFLREIWKCTPSVFTYGAQKLGNREHYQEGCSLWDFIPPWDVNNKERNIFLSILLSSWAWATQEHDLYHPSRWKIVTVIGASCMFALGNPILKCDSVYNPQSAGWQYVPHIGICILRGLLIHAPIVPNGRWCDQEQLIGWLIGV